ncbi:Lrp/AsnC family transcriptional regulator [Rhizobiaceae bacterium]|nr:Lrp/AsnC family transcriptional regulator [Rhizobiaceae bacterium]
MSDPNELDEADRRILRVLETEGRIPVSALAERIGLSKTPTANRLRRMERDGTIIGYRAIVDGGRTGQGHVAFTEVKLDDTRGPALQAFSEGALNIPEIEACHMIAGAFDYLLKVRTRDIGSYRRVLAERISTLPHVASTSSAIAMQTIRE